MSVGCRASSTVLKPFVYRHFRGFVVRMTEKSIGAVLELLVKYL